MIFVDVGYEFRERSGSGLPEACYRLYRGDGEVFYRTSDLHSALLEARRAATERGREEIRLLPGRQGHLELVAGERSLQFTPDDLPLDLMEYSPPIELPPGPARAVGADPGERGPAAGGPGVDQPGFAGEIDEEDAAGMSGVALSQGNEP